MRLPITLRLGVLIFALLPFIKGNDEPEVESDKDEQSLPNLVESEIPNIESEILNMESEIPNLESEILNPESEALNPESEILNPESAIPSLESEILNLESEIPNSGSEIPILQNHINESESLNITNDNSTKSNSSSQSKRAICLEMRETEDFSDVEVVDATTLQKILQNNPNITNRSTPAECYLIYFFSPYCPFSAQGSAYVNALARSIKDIKVYGLDSVEHHSVNSRYGVMGTPSLILFHNGNVVGRYNASEYATSHLESFIRYYTNHNVLPINVTSHDFKSNLPSQVIPSTSYSLYGAWIFLLTCGGWLFLSSEFYAGFTEAILNNWREAEAQHAHDD